MNGDANDEADEANGEADEANGEANAVSTTSGGEVNGRSPPFD